MRILSKEIIRLLSRWQFFAALLLGLCIQAFGVWQYYTSFAHSQMQSTSANQAVWLSLLATQIFFPLQIGLAVGDTLSYDRATGVIRYLIMRSSRTKYTVYKLTGSAAVAFCVTFVPILVGSMLCAGVFPVKYGMTAFDGYTVQTMHFMPGLFYHHFFDYVLAASLYTSACGIFLGTLAVLLGSFFRNTYLSVGLPWILYIGLSIAFIFSEVPILQSWVPLGRASIAIYSPALGPPWLPPLTWLVLAAITAVVTLQVMARRDIRD